MMMRLGPVVLVAVLQIPPASIYDDDETLGPVYEVAVLPIPPVVTGVGFLGSSAPDTASNCWTK